MIVTPLAFGANFRVALNEKGVKKEQITNEVNTAVLARESGVSVPQYQVTAFEYETKGEKGDFYKNPITRAHFENVFKNIY